MSGRPRQRLEDDEIYGPKGAQNPSAMKKLPASWELLLLLMMDVSEIVLRLQLMAVLVLERKLGLWGSALLPTLLLAMLELAAVAVMYLLLGVVLLVLV
jgi:hypothetical protein